jgi:hypothetical protein
VVTVIKLIQKPMKYKDITPKSLACMEIGCPAIFETNAGTFVLIGRKLRKSSVPGKLSQRIGAGEQAIEVPRELLQQLLGK